MADPSQAPEAPMWLDVAFKAVGLIVALVGGAFTLFQYLRAKGWRAGDLADSLIAQLETDDELAFACWALDWGGGPLIVPGRYRPLVEKIPEGQTNPTPSERGQVMEHDPKLMATALQVYFDVRAEPSGLIYRRCFDKLFAHLANINRLLSSKQLKLKDLEKSEGLKYWLQRIAVYEYPPSGLSGDQVFQPFLDFKSFGYAGVIDLGKKLGVKGWR